MISAVSSRRPAWRDPILVVAILLGGLIALPYLVTPFYSIGRPVSTLMLARWASGARVERYWVPLAAMAPSLPASVIAAEDARFCRHKGIDFAELREAIEDAESLADLRGASTLTQQTAKNLFLWPGRSVVRKVLEAPLALWLDFVLGKKRVLEIYLNIAEWGPHGEVGAEAAARRAFGKTARDLTAREAALLAAALPNPNRRDPGRPGPALNRLAGLYLRRAAIPQLASCVAPRRP